MLLIFSEDSTHHDLKEQRQHAEDERWGNYNGNGIEHMAKQLKNNRYMIIRFTFVV